MGINNLLLDIGLLGLGCKLVLMDFKFWVVIVGVGFGGLVVVEKIVEVGCDVIFIDCNLYIIF